jgi:site-specific recombinase XerD
MELQVNAFLASLDASPACSRSTRLAYASDLRVFLDFLQTELNRPPQISDLDVASIMSFLEAERQEGRKTSTISRRLATLRKFNLFLSNAGLTPGLTFIPETGITKQSDVLSLSPAELPFLTTEQIERLFVLIGTSPRPRALRDQALLLLMAEIGLSVGCITALDMNDLDLRSRRVHLQWSNGEDVWVPLGMVYPIVERYVKEARPDLNHHQDEPALFVSQLDGRLSRQGIWQILQSWGKLLDPPLKISPRRVRHTAAIRMARSGRPLSEIQILLGHRNSFSTRALLRRLRLAEMKAIQESRSTGGRNN